MKLTIYTALAYIKMSKSMKIKLALRVARMGKDMTYGYLPERLRVQRTIQMDFKACGLGLSI